ncbi:unnamed protein product [Amoebophrya sp. A25]|nr:unnamed protein product [Amoebophrya sp. A25]|eukprot:GSA25T00004096001.1
MAPVTEDYHYFGKHSFSASYRAGPHGYNTGEMHMRATGRASVPVLARQVPKKTCTSALQTSRKMLGSFARDVLSFKGVARPDLLQFYDQELWRRFDREQRAARKTLAVAPLLLLREPRNRRGQQVDEQEHDDQKIRKEQEHQGPFSFFYRQEDEDFSQELYRQNNSFRDAALLMNPATMKLETTATRRGGREQSSGAAGCSRVSSGEGGCFFAGMDEPCPPVRCSCAFRGLPLGNATLGTFELFGFEFQENYGGEDHAAAPEDDVEKMKDKTENAAAFKPGGNLHSSGGNLDPGAGGEAFRPPPVFVRETPEGFHCIVDVFARGYVLPRKIVGSAKPASGGQRSYGPPESSSSARDSSCQIVPDRACIRQFVGAELASTVLRADLNAASISRAAPRQKEKGHGEVGSSVSVPVGRCRPLLESGSNKTEEEASSGRGPLLESAAYSKSVRSYIDGYEMALAGLHHLNKEGKAPPQNYRGCPKGAKSPEHEGTKIETGDPFAAIVEAQGQRYSAAYETSSSAAGETFLLETDLQKIQKSVFFVPNEAGCYLNQTPESLWLTNDTIAKYVCCDYTGPV